MPIVSTVSQTVLLQSSKVPCPELFEQNIAPNAKFQSDRLAERISWTIHGRFTNNEDNC